MAYQKRAGGTWYTRVVSCSGLERVCSTETRLQRTAEAVEAWHKEVRTRLDVSGVLDAIVNRRIGLAEAYRLGEADTVARLAAEQAAALDTDLGPLLAEYLTGKRASARGGKSVDAYEKQIAVLRRLLVGDEAQPLRRSVLVVPRVAKALDALPVTDPTRNRYRAALSGWCKWLVRRGELELNPAREVGGYPENDGRTVWYEPKVAEKIVRATTDPLYRAREALFAGTGMDWSDMSRLRVRDVDMHTLIVRCHGSKVVHRNRSIRITEGWTLKYVRPAFVGRTGKHRDELLFPGGRRSAWEWHVRAVELVGAEYSTLHDWRHTYAVNGLRHGLSASLIAHQLGHGNAGMVWKRYGRFVPNSADYQRAVAAGSATNPATQHKPNRR